MIWLSKHLQEYAAIDSLAVLDKRQDSILVYPSAYLSQIHITFS